jgi:general secretion pathway protein M
MVKLFDKINENFMRWYDSLSDRERRLLALLFICLCLLLIFSTVFLATSKITNRRAELSRNRQLLSQVNELAGDYISAREKNERARMEILRNDVSLFTFIQGVTKGLNLAVGVLDQQRRPLPKSNIVEVSVKLSLNKLSIDKATALIEAMETSEYGELIKVTRLKVSKRFDEPELLDLQVTVSTWKSA